MKRFHTQYPGVYYREGRRAGARRGAKGEPERIYYIAYRREGKSVEEKVGRQYRDKMTPADAAKIRARRLEGEQSPREKKKRSAERMTFVKLWEAYIEERRGGRPIYAEKSVWEKYVKPTMGEKIPAELSPMDISRLKRAVKGRAPGYIRNILEVVRRLINFGEKNGLAQSALFKIQFPRVHNERTEFLTEEQRRRLLEVIDRWEDRLPALALKLALVSGLRRGEILRLKWADVDRENSFLHLRSPKGGKEERIPINDGIAAVLEELPDLGSPYLFPGKNPDAPRRSFRAVVRIYEAAEIDTREFRPFHGLRHTFASILASSGVELYQVQRLLTHKTPGMTQRYAHLSDEALRRASEKGAKLLTART